MTPAPGAGDSACVRPIPAGAYTRVPVFVYAEVVDSADRRARGSVDLIAQEVADRLRALVWKAAAGGAPSSDAPTALPPADSLLVDRATDGRVLVVARRGGAPVTWRVERGERADTLAADTAGAALVAHVFGEAVADGAVLVPDDALRGDSLAFELRLVRPGVDGPGRALQPVAERNPAPAFSLAVPWERRAGPGPAAIQLRYPEGALSRGFEGRVTLRFVIDTTGRAEARTVRDLWPAGVAPLTGDEGGVYAAFVAAARKAVLAARFAPARVAGCRVRQLVELPLAFTMSR